MMGRRQTFTRGWLAAVVGIVALVMLSVQGARAIDQAMPGDAHKHDHGLPAGHPPTVSEGVGRGMPPAEDRKAFREAIDLSAFRKLAIQHEEQVKVVDSWARQSLTRIANRKSIGGQDPVYTALDMAFRPEYWFDQNIIYVQAIPVRQQLGAMVETEAEQQRILNEARVSPRFLSRGDVQARLQEIAATDSTKVDAINKVYAAYAAFVSLGETMHLAPPEKPEAPWHSILPDLAANSPEYRKRAIEAGNIGIDEKTPAVEGYSEAQATRLLDTMKTLMEGWREDDAGKANVALAALAKELPAVQAQSYPSATKRSLEIVYTRSFSGTLVGFVYLAAMVLFLISAAGVSRKCYRWGFWLFTAALALHLAAMLVRWYLAGSISRIPIQNQFESVMGSALLGCTIGWVMELWKKNGLFGMAMSFVGFLAATACLVVPFVYGRSIGENIAPTAGILMTYWLYIHVNVVICSYALIGASFILGAMYLGAQLWHWINPLVEPGTPQVALAGGGVGGGLPPELEQVSRGRREFLEALDGANVIVMRLAFLFLGAGIIFGALWADQSWGRPWGWDPKETFALVTWLVYLILVHVRFAAPSTKGAWTAWLSVIGFGIMLFNWIGVNFWLVGLHSYA